MKFNLELSPLTIVFIVIIIILIIGNILQAIGSYSRMGIDDLYDNFPYEDKKYSKRLIANVRIESDKGDCNIIIKREGDSKSVTGTGTTEMNCDKYEYNDGTSEMSKFTKQLINEDV